MARAHADLGDHRRSAPAHPPAPALERAPSLERAADLAAGQPDPQSTVEPTATETARAVTGSPPGAKSFAGRPGEPLDPAVRVHFEHRLGWDFGAVRVHTDTAATDSALSLGARAYTLGQSIVFGRGEYRPDTAAGGRLLGHELAHVAQQGRGTAGAVVQPQLMSVDWQSVADRMTLSDLESAVLRLRTQVEAEVESSEAGLQVVEQLRVFERTLSTRQEPILAAERKTAAARTRAREVLASVDDPRAAAEALIDLRMSMDAMFAQGFMSGAVASIPPGELEDFQTELRTRPGEFYGGYLVGIPVGVWHGLTGLIQGLGELLRIGFWMSPTGMMIMAAEQAYEFARDREAWLASRRAEAAQMRALIEALNEFGAELRADPTAVLQWSTDAGVAVGEEFGELLTTEFLRQTPYNKGYLVGDFVGQIVFEILLEIILALATEGIGNALRATAAVGQGARAGGRLANIIRRMLEASPALRRVIRAITGHVDEAADAARVISEGADVGEDVAGGTRTAERLMTPADTPPAGGSTPSSGGGGSVTPPSGGGGGGGGGMTPPSGGGGGGMTPSGPPRRATVYTPETDLIPVQPMPPVERVRGARSADAPFTVIQEGVEEAGERIRRLDQLRDRMDDAELDFPELGFGDEEEFLRRLEQLSDAEAEELLRDLERRLDMLDPDPDPALAGIGNDAPAMPDAPTEIDRPLGSPPIENQITGETREVLHAREVVPTDPRLARDIHPRAILRDLREALRSGQPGALRRFAEAFPAEGARQVYLPTGRGGRWIDHMYIDGARVVLRESKDTRIFRLTRRHLRQIENDLGFLRRYDGEVRVEWRITGDVDADAIDYLNGLVDEYPGLFSYRLDAPGPYSYVDGRYVVPRGRPIVTRRR